MVANTAVYLAWQEPENFKTMRTHFLVSESSLANGYWHTALTAAFSHNSFNHLFGNMFTLYFFGRDVALTCGGAYLLNLYLVGGVVSSLAHVGYERYERRKRKPHVGFFDKREHESFFSWFDERMDKIARLAAPASLGASGAVNSIIAMSVLMMPHRKIYLYGIPLVGVVGIRRDVLVERLRRIRNSRRDWTFGALRRSRGRCFGIFVEEWQNDTIEYIE